MSGEGASRASGLDFNSGVGHSLICQTVDDRTSQHWTGHAHEAGLRFLPPTLVCLVLVETDTETWLFIKNKNPLDILEAGKYKRGASVPQGRSVLMWRVLTWVCV